MPIIRIANLGGRFVLDVHVERGCQRSYRVAIGKQRESRLRPGSAARLASPPDQRRVERLARESHGGTWDTLPCAPSQRHPIWNTESSSMTSCASDTASVGASEAVERSWVARGATALADMGGRSVATMAGVLLFHAEPSPSSLTPPRSPRVRGHVSQDVCGRAGGPVWRHLDLALAFARKHLPLRAGPRGGAWSGSRIRRLRCGVGPLTRSLPYAAMKHPPRRCGSPSSMTSSRSASSGSCRRAVRPWPRHLHASQPGALSRLQRDRSHRRLGHGHLRCSTGLCPGWVAARPNSAQGIFHASLLAMALAGRTRRT